MTERRREEHEPRKVRFQPKSLYQIVDGAMITGVCQGIAVYFNTDVRWIRAAFIILALLTKGAWIFAYLVLVVTVPVAKTPSDYARARGEILQS